jgi:hypothetical protein
MRANNYPEDCYRLGCKVLQSGILVCLPTCRTKVMVVNAARTLNLRNNIHIICPQGFDCLTNVDFWRGDTNFFFFYIFALKISALAIRK